MEVRAAFHAQAAHCANLGSEQTARYCRLFADHLTDETTVGRKLLGWTGDPSSGGDALALRLMGGLHALVLSAEDPALAQIWGQGMAPTDAALWAEFSRVLRAHEGHLLRWLQGPPQTNEIRRSVPLAAMGHWLSARFNRPLVLSELGASAGLNLCWPDWRIDVPGGHFGPAVSPVTLQPDWRGKAPVIAAPQILGRAGVDLQPVDPERDRLRLMSYIWAGQPDRLQRTKAALDHIAPLPRQVVQGDAADWLRERLQVVRGPVVHLVCHTIAWQYFPPATTTAITALLRAQAGQGGTVLLRFGMERDHTGLEGAALTLHDLRTGVDHSFGRVDFHGRWIDWCPPQAQAGGG